LQERRLKSDALRLLVSFLFALFSSIVAIVMIGIAIWQYMHTVRQTQKVEKLAEELGVFDRKLSTLVEALRDNGIINQEELARLKKGVKS